MEAISDLKAVAVQFPKSHRIPVHPARCWAWQVPREGTLAAVCKAKSKLAQARAVG